MELAASFFAGPLPACSYGGELGRNINAIAGHGAAEFAVAALRGVLRRAQAERNPPGNV